MKLLFREQIPLANYANLARRRGPSAAMAAAAAEAAAAGKALSSEDEGWARSCSGCLDSMSGRGGYLMQEKISTDLQRGL